MKRLAMHVVMALLLTSSAAAAETYDLTQYWMVTPGQWVTMTGQSGSEVRIAVVQDGNVLKLEMRQINADGSTQLMRRFDQVLAGSSIILTGEYNHKDDESVWNPAVSLPRYVEVGQGFQFSLEEQLTAITYPLFITMVVENDRYSITTPAGTFHNCLKIVMNEIDHNSATTDVYFLAKEVGIIRYIMTGSYEDGPFNVSINHSWELSGYGTD